MSEFEKLRENGLTGKQLHVDCIFVLEETSLSLFFAQMVSKKTSPKQTTMQPSAMCEHDYSQMDVASNMKRKPPPTPTKSTRPPLKVKAGQESTSRSDDAVLAAIERLTSKIEDFGSQLRENTIMVANISRLIEMNPAEIKDCKTKIATIERAIPKIVKENRELKEKVADLERYKRGWNLKIHGLKEKDKESIREHVVGILSKIAPQWADVMDTTVDTVHRLGRREEGRHRQVILQFVTRRHRDAFWKITKNCQTCKNLGIRFKEDFSKADREARAAVWPKMERARAEGKNVYYRGHVGYINGTRVTVE
ncbi:uncharacterized protein LOC101159895 [Oryzias latipes]